MRNWKIWLLVATSLAAIVLIVLTSYAFQHCIEESQGYAGGQTLKERTANILPLLNTYRGCTGEFLHKNGEAVIALFTVVLAISTIFLWDATRDAAKGGERAAKIAEQALTKLERAFVFPYEAGFEMTSDDHGNRGWGFRFEWRNNGNTPARDVFIHVSWTHFAEDIPDDFNFPDIGVPNTSPMYLAPKSSTFTDSLAVDLAVLESVRQGHIHLFFWGWVTYRDIFEGTPVHITRFCREVRIRGRDDLYSAGNAEVSFRTYRRHNCIDEDCGDYSRRPEQAEPG